MTAPLSQRMRARCAAMTPWYFECGWWSPWCFLDEWTHRIMNRLRGTSTDGGSDELPGPLKRICKRHDRAVARYYAKREPADD